MKKFSLGIFRILICIYLLPSTSYAFISYTDEVCFRERSILTPSKDIYISTSYQDILAKQGDIELDVFLYDWKYKYIPFSTNILQENASGSYENIYSFGNIDTSKNTEIVLSFQEKIKKESFSMHFSYDSQYYNAKFYISEDNQYSYSQVLQGDISDYSPTHIKISFLKNGNEPIREIIKIRNLSITRNTSIWSIIPANLSEPITIYAGNTCGQTRDDILLGSESYNGDFISPIFQVNPLFKENMSDTDNDGIPDSRDNCKTLANTDQKDINQNKVGDACEFDSDLDGIPDEIDNCRNTPNPDQKDNDGDGIGDVCDNCELYNPDQFDIDGNKIGDRCDTAKKYLEENDIDGDKIENNRDNCPSIANPLQEDDDNDGVGNICDNCKNYQNSDQKDKNKNGVGDICEDSDEDGIEGLQDNCPSIANPLQEDDDNDGIGNICEDDERDSIIFEKDNCPYVYNPNQLDTDNDGIGDICDEEDNRFLESNKAIIIGCMILIGVLFLIFIYRLSKQIQK